MSTDVQTPFLGTPLVPRKDGRAKLTLRMVHLRLEITNRPNYVSGFQLAPLNTQLP